MHKNKIIILYLLLLLFHIAHVFEEVWGHFRAIDVYGLGLFLILNWIFIIIPAVIFYYLLNEKRQAYILSIVYAGLMILNGLGHNIATLSTGKYFGGFAGGFTGIAFIFIGPPLIYFLSKSIKKP
jgi:hypothetical protein